MTRQPDAPPTRATPTLSRRLARWCVRAAVLVAAIVGTIVMVRAFASRALPELQPHHTVELAGDLQADDADGMTFEGLMALEADLFRELDAEIYAANARESLASPPRRHGLVRYARGSLSDPDAQDTNWNRSWELIPERVRGGVLLLHGLTDSPYSMRSIGEVFHEHGYYVLALRMPGHGTIPAALLETTWQDWMAAVRIGARHVRQQAGDGRLILGGYSTGGGLALRLTLESLKDDTLPRVDGIYMFSPAIGVSSLGAFSGWHRALSWLPYFERFKWLGVSPEYDPFKYASFPKNAGRQVHLLTRAVQAALDSATTGGRLGDLPPIITFQSVVDTTVDTNAVITHLYDRLSGPGHELILFDINRSAYLEPFMRNSFRVDATRLEQHVNLRYRLTVVTNSSPEVADVIARSRGAGAPTATETLGLAWPAGFFSLSHVAIPFPPDDPIYGWAPGATLPLGRLEVRGERRLLRIPAEDILRLRHNPFFPYLEQRLDTLLDREEAEDASREAALSGTP
ncbi:MAG: alpha/beta hydrolase [Planctomycetota bacterium]